MARPLIFLHVFCIGGILATSITHGFTRRRPVRLLQIPPESGICPTDFTDIHRFFVGGFGHADFADDADFFIGYFYSSDFTELIRRFLPMSITHGFTRRRPVRSLQIPPVSGICPTDFTDIHRFFLLQFPSLPSLPFHLFPPFSFLHSHFSLHYPFLLFYLFTFKKAFLLFYLFTFKKSRCQKIEKNKQNIKRKLHYFFYFCREILNL